MSKRKVLVVEDEPIIADDIAASLEDLGYEVIEAVASANDAIHALKKNKADVVLLDIQIDGSIDGTMLAEIIQKEFSIPFIFLTSNADPFTIDKVKQLKPAGFIVKPFDDRDLHSSIEIALHRTSQDISEDQKHQEDDPEHIFVKHNQKLEKVAVNDILYAQAYDNYCFVHTEKQRFLLPNTLKTIESKLKDRGFLRVHRSYLVNLKRINVIEEFHLKIGEQQIPISKNYRSELIKNISLL